jgi:hypothetical protein
MSAATCTQVRNTEQQDSLPEIPMRTSSCTLILVSSDMIESGMAALVTWDPDYI